MDMAALSIFSPTSSHLQAEEADENSDHLEITVDVEEGSRKRQKVVKPLNATDLIHAIPRYKVVGNLSLWNIASIDIVLISSPMAMLGLPFITQMEGFCAKVIILSLLNTSHSRIVIVLLYLLL